MWAADHSLLPALLPLGQSLRPLTGRGGGGVASQGELDGGGGGVAHLEQLGVRGASHARLE